MKNKLYLFVCALVLLAALSSALLSTPTSQWKLNEVGFATVANDSKGMLNLTVNNTVSQFQIGKIGNAIRLNVSNQNVMVNNTAIPTAHIFDLNNFTVAFWINGTNGAGGTGYTVIGRAGDSATKWTINTNNGNNNLSFTVNSVGVLDSPNYTFNGSYNRVVFVREGTGANKFKVYINTINVGNATLASNLSDRTEFLRFQTPNAGGGINLDDVVIYGDYAWTLEDIAADWNNGQGNELGISSVSLSSPADLSENVATTINFTSILQFDGGATNQTLIINYSNGSLFTQNFSLVSGTVATLGIPISGFIPGYYNWTVIACGTGNSSTCAIPTSPRSFLWGYTKTSETYSSSTTTLSTEQFILNVSVGASISSASAILVYNNTNYTTSQTSSGNNISFSKSLNIPTVSSVTVKNFSWIITVTDTNGNTYTFYRTPNTQTINVFSIDNCTVNTALILNYTLKDEDGQFLLGSSYNTSIQVEATISSIADNTQYSVLNFTYNNTNPARVCINQSSINNSQSYRLDAVAQYSALNRVTEFYFIQNKTVQSTTIPYNINLFDLLITNSQSFLLFVSDSSYIPISGAVVEIYRKYISEAAYKIVEAPKTDSSGHAIAHLVLEDALYKFIVKKDDATIITITDQTAYCTTVPTDCEISITEEGAQIDFDSINSQSNISYTLSHNSTLINLVYAITDGFSATVQMNVTVLDSFNNNTICSSYSTRITDTLSCNPSAYEGSTVYVALFKNGVKIASFAYTIGSDVNRYVGIRVLLMIVMAFIPLLFIQNSPLFLMSIFLSFVIMIGFNIYIGSVLFGVSSILMFVIIFIAFMYFQEVRQRRNR